MPIPQDTSVEAEYADGYVYNETEHGDIAQYDPGDPKHNVFYDILNKLPENEHGRMVRFSVFWRDHRYDINWRHLPDNARPIRFRNGNRTLFPDGSQEFWWSGVDFGYQFTENGKNIKDIQGLR